ncbi:L,D-transpeptidase family protein [Halomonas sp. ISL-60]|uniref:L,D-transpeptidase family protein n=1 Tax=Halomonas sp. ISL-56 TaxID=2819149 RepID=UPI001BE4F792|nr:L,D-transpeptidase family protein [Halomonas sp. ISL-56]MBT2771410.1 L,D-transpeptidase family protein [Halomonas sp. ISL-60]MBT2801525.1 L,D-transpeptidase family protein [Halomonas sp. ISL-56]
MKPYMNRIVLKNSVKAVRKAPLVSVLIWPIWAHANMSTVPDNHYPLPERGDIIGQNYQVIANQEDTLIDIARVHNVGYEEIRSANPDVSLWVPGEGTTVTIPRQHILPHVPRTGIVINVAELRLYYYPDVSNDETPWVETYPIGIGREGYNTPLGITETTIRLENPAWYPPRSMREEAAARGEPAPAVVPPGPENPLGDHAILLDIPGYLIHGTNQPDGIGMRASRGCIRMYPEDIESIFYNIPSGTQVNIIDQAIKVGGNEGGDAFVQVFKTVDTEQANIDSLKAMLLSQSLAEEVELAMLENQRLNDLFEQPDDQIISLSTFYQSQNENDEEAIDMDIYQMITQIDQRHC